MLGSCEKDETLEVNENAELPDDEPSFNFYYNWKMVVNTFDSYNGIEQDKAFINILLGETLPNGIETTNTTYFGLKPYTNELKLKLQHYGWALWEAYGHYPIIWKFNFSQTEETFELEGLANLGSSCK
tara:strand:+ start:232 stop:615 length:384 start_codon:yes stop_codon:yes gene_type:complete